MGRGEKCSGCGRSLGSRAAFCPGCGQPRSAPIVELERLDLPRPAVTESEQAVVTNEAGPKGRGRRLLGVVGGFGLFGLLVAALASGGGDGGEDAASTTTEVPVATTTEPPPTSGYSTVPLGATLPPPTQPVPTQPPTTPAPTIPFVNQRRGPVLGGTTGGWSLYVGSPDGVRRVDLDTGSVQLLSMPQSAGGFYRMVPAGGKFVVSGGSGSYLAGADLSGAIVQLAASNRQQLIGVTEAGDRFWFITYPASGGNATGVRLIDSRGRAIAEPTLRDIDAYPVGVLGDRLVLQGAGRIFTMDASGRIEPYAYGQVVTTNSRFVLWTGCDDRARCTYRLGELDRPDTGRTSLETTFLVSGGEMGGWDQLAPDGATVLGAVADGRSQMQMHIVDLATGSVLEADRPITGSAVWSPDGAWLFRGSVAGIDAISVRTGRVVPIDVPGLVITNGTGVLAVG